MSRANDLSVPLTDDELDELEQFLKSPAVADETMPLVALDGYLTAIIIGPTTLAFEQWFAGIWGSNQAHLPRLASEDQAQHIVSLIIRHFNGIISELEEDPNAIAPLFESIVMDEGEELIEGETWAQGFMAGVRLCHQDWQPLLDDTEGTKAFLPIYLLGADRLTPAQEKLVETREQRSQLAELIPDSIAWIYRFWQSHRYAELQRTNTVGARVDGVKVGRNDPCPCGSGKKFKKCCGAPAALH